MRDVCTLHGGTPNVSAWHLSIGRQQTNSIEDMVMLQHCKHCSHKRIELVHLDWFEWLVWLDADLPLGFRVHVGSKLLNQFWGHDQILAECGVSRWRFDYKISVGGIPNSKEVCIFEVYINYRLALPLLYWLSMQPETSIVAKYKQKYTFKVWKYDVQKYKLRKVYSQSTKVYFWSTEPPISIYCAKTL